ncbi:MAG: hypothetical protein IJV71_12055 [Lachnospiraceae bacterium]|nr:hypothetical protein [Lachnospiraceae bacterium]
MYEIFGEFNGVDELNESALGLRNEGDLENIKVLAKENGIPECYVEMFIAGDMDILCDAETAAIGKLDVEAADIKATEIVADWVSYIKGLIMKDKDMAAAVRKKGKSLKLCIAKILEWSFKNAYAMDKDICKAAGVPSNCKLGMPGAARVKKMIREYYMGK